MKAVFRHLTVALAIAIPSPAWSGEGDTGSAAKQDRRFMSVDYCADQYVMALAARSDVVAVSREAETEYSYLASRASAYKKVRPTIEEILMEDPELVVRQWGGGYGASQFMERLNLPVVQVSFAQDLKTTQYDLTNIGQALEGHAMAHTILSDMNSRLENLRQARATIEEPKSAIYITPGGLTSGAGTFIDIILREAGLENLIASMGHNGWTEMNLEMLIRNPPDLFVGAFFDLKSNHVNQWSVARHHLLRQMMTDTPTVLVPGRLVACSAWFAVDAMELIHNEAYAKELSSDYAP